MVPCVIFEDEHLLVVNKPAGWNTHAPSPYAGEGIYDWLKHREPRWSSLAILHRLDKETSGVLVFGKTTQANRSLTDQFTRHRVRKTYLLLTQGKAPRKEFIAKSALMRVGEKYASRPGGESAETRFTPVVDARLLAHEKSGLHLVRAEPLTGRTHQIRVHAAENGFPILGDTLYGGPAAPRVFLHALEIAFEHPATQAAVRYSAPVDFEADPRIALRSAIIEPGATDGYRLIHGGSDGWAGWFVDKLGDFLLSQSEAALTTAQRSELERLAGIHASRGAYHKTLSRQVRQSSTETASPQPVLGEAAGGPFSIVENGVRYELSFSEGYSVGLFLDQRDNRRRLLGGQISAGFPLEFAGGELLNVFAYTCGFSVCAAKAGARTTSLDLSKKYLEWGRRNFALNGKDPAAHDFIYGDAFDWLRRLAKKGRGFDAVVLDPPTFSKSKETGAFTVSRDFVKLVSAALPVLKSGGILLASTNAADWRPEAFEAAVETAVAGGGRTITHHHYVPQPPDFPVSKAQPGYLKTAWFRVK
jgi:23S rRNA (cytosine1962-C5)-methyltransferase